MTSGCLRRRPWCAAGRTRGHGQQGHPPECADSMALPTPGGVRISDLVRSFMRQNHPCDITANRPIHCDRHMFTNGRLPTAHVGQTRCRGRGKQCQRGSRRPPRQRKQDLTPPPVRGRVGLDGVVRLWNRRTWELHAALTGHQQHGDTIAFAPRHDDTLASVTNDGTIRLWDLNEQSAQGPAHGPAADRQCLRRVGRADRRGPGDGTLDIVVPSLVRSLAAVHDQRRAVEAQINAPHDLVAAFAFSLASPDHLFRRTSVQ